MDITKMEMRMVYAHTLNELIEKEKTSSVWRRT